MVRQGPFGSGCRGRPLKIADRVVAGKLEHALVPRIVLGRSGIELHPVVGVAVVGRDRRVRPVLDDRDVGRGGKPGQVATGSPGL